MQLGVLKKNVMFQNKSPHFSDNTKSGASLHVFPLCSFIKSKPVCKDKVEWIGIKMDPVTHLSLDRLN